MRSRLRGGKYTYRDFHGHRSGLEDALAAQIKHAEAKESYEQYSLPYTVPESRHTYTPDFVLSNGIIIEAKGIFETKDRQKHLLIKKQYPHLDIRFVFSNPHQKINKSSKTTYAAWCQKHGYPYAARIIPAAWFKEPPKDASGLQPKPRKGKQTMLTFKTRERTEAIRLDYHPEYKGKTHRQILQDLRGKGSLNLGYHYILHTDGTLEKGIDYDLYASPLLVAADASIYILVTSDRLSDMAHLALKELAETLRLPVRTE